MQSLKQGLKCTGRLAAPKSPSQLIKRSLRPLHTPSTSSRTPRTSRTALSTTAAIALLCSAALPFLIPVAKAEERPAELDEQEEKSATKTYTLAEVKAHGADADRVWVIKGRSVYDITEWIPGHPGGSVILQAAGGNVDTFWSIFSIHQKPEVYEILESYKIGEVAESELDENGELPTGAVEDPFRYDPERDPRLITLSDRPRNAETPADCLQDFITPNQVFYVRNHLWVPKTTEAEHRLTIELSDGTEREYTIDELKKRFKKHTVHAVLQCSGNRRSHMSKNSRSTNGLPWQVGAIGNAEWTGVKLRDVLKDAGLDVNDLPDEAKHAQFLGAEAYGSSIPIDKAVDAKGDVILAFEMNGQPLPRDHGAPVRVLVPGTIAARSVKWINRITISDEESTSQWQRRDYKLFGPNTSAKKADWTAAPSIQEFPVQSAITRVQEVSAQSKKDRELLRIYGLEDDSIIVDGYALAGGGRSIARVDVSVDGGHSWRQAQLLPDDSLGAKSWSWKRWRFTVPKYLVGLEIVVKATDDSYNSQPEFQGPIWNFRGNLATAWHRVPFEPSG